MPDDRDIDRANDILDRILAGEPCPADHADRVLVQTVHTLTTLHDAFRLNPTARSRIWEDMMSNTSQVEAVNAGIEPAVPARPNNFTWTPVRRKRAWNARQDRWWPIAEIAAAILVAISLIAGVTAYHRATTPGPRIDAPAALAPSTLKLYVSNSSEDIVEPQQFQPLDPITLANLPDQPGITFGANDWDAAVSGDGSTIASISYAPTNSEGTPFTNGPDGLTASGDDVTIIVRDGLTGDERIRFHPPVPVLFPRLSDDGSRLVVMVHPDFARTLMEQPGRGPARWYVFDTNTGRVLTSVKGGALYSSAIQHFWIDANAGRLYYLPILGSMDETKPPLLQLYAYDLTTGKQIGHLDLPDITAGSWTSHHSARGEPILSDDEPGAALSPDGRQLAIVHADADLLTLIDVEHLKITRTIPLTRPSSVLDTVLGLLPLAPQDAAAKSMEGTQLSAVYSPDGRRLYVYGQHGMVDNNGRTTYHGLGLRLIDLKSGTITAEALGDTWINQVAPAGNGQNIYVFGPNGSTAYGAAGENMMVLRRLDATSLATRAERVFDGYRFLMLKPTGGART